MNTKMSKKPSRLTDKLKSVLTDIHVDVFGHEARVTGNILSYFETASKRLQIPRERLVLRIFSDPDNVRVCIYQQGKIIRQIPISELVTIFTQLPCHPDDAITQKTKMNMHRFMQGYAGEHDITLSNLQLCILTGPDKVWILGYNRITPTGDIPLKTLIKHFMG